MSIVDANPKVSRTGKMAYGLLGLSRGLAGQMVSLYLTLFYTDVFCLPIYVVPVFLLIGKLWEPFSKQVAGFFIGKLHFRQGPYRQIIGWAIIPYAILSAALFYTPQFPVIYKIVYAALTYGLWCICNSILSIAHNSLLPMMSGSTVERTTLNSFKIIASAIATLIVSYWGLSLVENFGQGNQQSGFFIVMVFFSLLSALLQFFAYRNIQESEAPHDQKQITLSLAVKSITKDRKLLLLFAIYLFYWVACTFKNQSTVYYFKYVINQPGYIGTFFMLGTVASFVINGLMGKIVKKFAKEKAMLYGLIGCGFVLAIMYMTGADTQPGANSSLSYLLADAFQISVPSLSSFFVSNPLFFFSITNFLFGIMSGIPANLIYVFLAESIDAKNKEYHVNLGSWLYSAMDNFAKIGIALSSFVFAQLLASNAYSPEAVNSPTVLNAISSGFFFLPILFMAVCVVMMIQYNKNNAKNVV